MESMDDLGPTLLYRSHILKLEADKEALRSHFSRECAALESAHAESEARRLSVSREYGVAVASMACSGLHLVSWAAHKPSRSGHLAK